MQNYPGRAENPHPWVPSALPAPVVPTFHLPEDFKEEFNLPCPGREWQELLNANLWAVAPLQPVIINSGEIPGLGLPAGLGTAWDRGMSLPMAGVGLRWALKSSQHKSSVILWF